jgi:hypothetical protein
VDTLMPKRRGGDLRQKACAVWCKVTYMLLGWDVPVNTKLNRWSRRPDKVAAGGLLLLPTSCKVRRETWCSADYVVRVVS